MHLNQLNGINKKQLDALHKHHVHNVKDILNWVPKKIIDRSRITHLDTPILDNRPVTVYGYIQNINEVNYYRKKLEVTITDGFGKLKAIFFHQIGVFKKILYPNMAVLFHGTIKVYRKQLSMIHPSLDIIAKYISKEQIEKNIIPIYPSNQDFKDAAISNRTIRHWVKQILKNDEYCQIESVPKNIMNEHQLLPKKETLQYIHFPDSITNYQKGMERLKFEEFFLFQLTLKYIRETDFKFKKGYQFNDPQKLLIRKFLDQIPFELTKSQKEIIGTITNDMASGKQMNRLLQGDVGMGKTIIAFISLLKAIEHNYQAVFMAPTEILIRQHYDTFTQWSKNLNISIRLLTGGQKTALRRDILSDIKGGGCDLILGTHALFEDQVHFYRLGIVIIDEQHRFGVNQRAKLKKKGISPHVLVMSATPIPRTLASITYGHLEYSMLTEFPAYRKPIITHLIKRKNHKQIFSLLEEILKTNKQAYFIYPLIEESERLSLKDATQAYERLSKRYPQYRVGLIHGQLSQEEKIQIMQDFSQGLIHILVATSVIEVGIDVPNATLMIIIHPERFGLAQIHQLRGRIGRGHQQGTCLLVLPTHYQPQSYERLKKLKETQDGFEIAKHDLKLRGIGDLIGTQQSGLPSFQFIDLYTDLDISQKAQESALKLWQKFPFLKDQSLTELRKVIDPMIQERREYYGLG